MTGKTCCKLVWTHVLQWCSYNYTVEWTIGDSAFIYQGDALRVRWMRYNGTFPARDFLRAYPEDYLRFKERCEEMGQTGRIRLPSQGHQLEGAYHELYEFKMPDTRAWGFRVQNVFLVAYAAKKEPKKKKQERDYKTTLAMRADYLTRLSDD